LTRWTKPSSTGVAVRYPFDDSGSAAAHYREDDLLLMMAQNLADVHRTWELNELVRRVVSPKDVTEKKIRGITHELTSSHSFRGGFLRWGC